MSLESTRYRLGVDIGGTFTDLLLMDEASRAALALKVPSTPPGSRGRDRRRSSSSSQRDMASRSAEIGYFSHGTTLGVNTLLQRDGAAVGAADHERLSRHPRAAPPAPAQGQRPLRAAAARRWSPRGRVAEVRRAACSPDGEVDVPIDRDDVAGGGADG